MTATKTDKELWEDVRNGSNKSFADLFNRYWQKIYITAFAHIKNKEVCEDIVHDIFLNLWQKRTELNINIFEAYILAATRYQVYKTSKSIHVKKMFFSTDPAAFPEEINFNEGEHKLVFDGMKYSVKNCIEKLPSRCAEIFYLSRKEFLSNDEIAGRLNISKRTVENQITYALHHIRIFLKEKSFLLLPLFYFLMYRR